MRSFSVGDEAVALPAGASALSRRTDVRCRDRHLFSLSQGPFRAYLYPVYTPSGVPVTSESPVDHPHHNSVWIAADRVVAELPFAGGDSEPGTYNFYVNDTFQGRAPGRIEAVGLEHEEREGRLRLWQRLLWRGPREWGAPGGRVVATEERAHRRAPPRFGQRHRPALAPDAVRSGTWRSAPPATPGSARVWPRACGRATEDR